MPLAFVLDEHLRGELRQAILSHNAKGSHPVDAVCVGDPPDLPLGSTDPDILLWAERHNRILVSCDESTMKTHLADHLRNGHRSPGVFLIRKGTTTADAAFFLAAAAHASEATDWQDLGLTFLESLRTDTKGTDAR
jgi:hypothetical protein